MRQSMTGFASVQGSAQATVWTWELRGVNGKGLDLRLRLPEGIDGLEPATRKRISEAVARGTIQVSLRMGGQSDATAPRLDPEILGAVLGAMARIEAQAAEAGVALSPSSAAEIVALRGILTSEPERGDDTALRDALLADLDTALGEFVAMRQAEGRQMSDVLSRQIAEIATLVEEAEAACKDRSESQAERLRAQLARVTDNTDRVEPERIAQELALIAVKSDVTEELDRLRAHVAAARALLKEPGAVGRKLDFLMQEFNREANTLCAKSGDAALTQIGLALKAVIDRMREQVQNVE